MQVGLTVLSAAILVLLAYFFIRLIGESKDALSKFGLSFVFGNDWDVSRLTFHGAPLLFGTIVTSAIALIIGVPIAVATALFLTELCPERARGPLSMLVDLLAAVPSVVYGLWGVFVLIPRLLPAEKWVASTFSFIPFVGGQASGPNYFIAGLILAIMILPIVSAISREVIGNAPVIGHSIFSQGYSLAAVIANEFGEAASTPIHSSALFAAGLVLFVLTLLVNILARWFVARGTRGQRGSSGADPDIPVAVAAATLGDPTS
jgi:ABC-type phosphate transport system permease subunit